RSDRRPTPDGCSVRRSGWRESAPVDRSNSFVVSPAPHGRVRKRSSTLRVCSIAVSEHCRSHWTRSPQDESHTQDGYTPRLNNPTDKHFVKLCDSMPPIHYARAASRFASARLHETAWWRVYTLSAWR